MSLWNNPLLLIAVAVPGILLAYLLAVVLFRLGCAMADLEPSVPRSLGVVGVTFVLLLGALAGFYWLAWPLDADSAGLIGPWRGLALVVGLLVTWILSTLLYALLLAASVKKGFIVATFERVLGALVAALVCGLILVILAIWQILGTRPQQEVPLSEASLAPLHSTMHQT